MSYLHMYESSKGIASDEHEHDARKVEEESKNGPIQAKYVGQNLSSSIAEEILSTLEAVHAINLSHNNIDVFPKTISSNLLALDLSFNHINTPIVLNSSFNIVELNLSNNNITDLRGLSMLISIEYLNLSENLISTVDGLENMKNLSSLKLSYNRISNFQGLRLLSYNSILTEIWMEGNPIESDVYYKVKLLNCIPNIKTLDGKTIWRRTAIQNQLINDNIKYSELYQRKPDDVEKYALLSKRSSSQLLSESVLNTFSGSMLTMQSLNNNNTNTTNANNTTVHNTSYNNSNTNSTSKQNHNTTSISNSNSQYYTQDSLPSPPKPEQLRRLPSNLRHLSEVTTVTAQNNSYSYTPSQTPSTTNNHNTIANSTSSNKESKNDISMLPVHLQKQLKQLQQSPSPPKRSSTRSHSSQPSSTTVATNKHTTGTASTGTTSNSTKGATDQRAYSPLPWRRPPSITPNLETKFKSNRSNSVKKLRSDGIKSDTLQRELQQQTFSTEQKKKNNNTNNNHQSQVSITLKNDDNLRNKQATPSTTAMNISTHSQSFRRNNYSFSSSQKQQQPQSQQTQVPTTPRNYSSTISINNTIEKTQKVLSTTPSFWMHPGLNPSPTNPTTPNGCLLGPPPNRFDSTQMERTISSSVIALQQSFDADQRQNTRDVNESFRGRSMLRTPSTKRLIHTKSMERQDSSRKLYNNTSSNNSIASRSVSPTRRSISQTRSSMGRQSFNAEILRSRQETEEKARDLAEAHTFERPTPVSPHRNAVYTIHQGVHSPTTGSRIGIGYGVVETPSSMGGSVFTFTSSKLAFSPAKAASRNGSQASVLPGHTASPPRISSTERILQHYTKQDHQCSQHNNNPAVVLLDEPIGVQNHLKLSSIPENNSISMPNEETKDTVPITSCTETPSNVVAEDSGNSMDESPYKRFIRLRERLSAKYLETEHTLTTQTQPSASTPSTTEVVAAKQPLSVSHVYDYARKMNVDAVEGMLNPVLNSPNAADFGEVESKIVELQEQDLQFQKLKEQYQQQYQAQYDSMRRDYDAKLGSNPDTTCSTTNTAATMHPQTPSMTVPTVSTATPVAQAMAPVLTHTHLTPPLTGTTDVLKDLIERRRSVLGRITQPNELSPDKQHRSSSTGSIEHLPTGQGIHDAISALKNRQSASVNILQSVTRDRPVQHHVNDNLSQVSINTPALHPSITNYSQLTNISPIYASQSVMLPAGTSSLPSGNNFLSRLTANNPYMQSIGTTPSATTGTTTADGVGIMGMSGYPQMDVSRSFEPNTPYIPQFLPTPYQQPQQQVHMYSGYPPRPPKPFYG